MVISHRLQESLNPILHPWLVDCPRTGIDIFFKLIGFEVKMGKVVLSKKLH